MQTDRWSRKALEAILNADNKNIKWNWLKHINNIFRNGLYQIKNLNMNDIKNSNVNKCVIKDLDKSIYLFIYLFTCRNSKINNIRIAELNQLETNLCELNYHETWNYFIASDLNTKLLMLLGSTNVNGQNEGTYTIFDKSCKNYLKKAWKARCDNLSNVNG